MMGNDSLYDLVVRVAVNRGVEVPDLVALETLALSAADRELLERERIADLLTMIVEATEAGDGR